jgi:hypothetical protein
MVPRKPTFVIDNNGSMRDTTRVSQECVGNEALGPSDSTRRISLPIDLSGHAGGRVLIFEFQEFYARIRFTASRGLESLRSQCADKSISRGPRGKSTSKASVKLWRHCQRGGLIFGSPRTGAPITPSRRYSSQNCRNPFRPTARQDCHGDGTSKKEDKPGDCLPS